MATKQEEMIDGCLSAAHPDEPVFVLRGQDMFAPICVQLWITLAEMFSTAKTQKLEAARATREAMLRWPKQKMPD